MSEPKLPMAEPKFTPGPWTAKTLRHESACASGVEYAVYGPSGEFIATVWGSPEKQKLIAAAPEMHDFGETTAEMFRLMLDTMCVTPAVRKMAEERIAEWENIAKKANYRQ